VTELAAANGALVRVLSGSSYSFSGPDSISSSNYQFDSPHAVSSDGTRAWGANCFNNSVSELSAATGARVAVAKYGFSCPDAISSDGTDVWATNYALDSVTGFPAG
jgi:hypothetical protein